MKETIIVRAEARDRVGSSAMGRVRREGRIPAVVYSEGRPGENVQIVAHDFAQMMKHHHSEQMIVDLDVAGSKPRKVLLKAMQHHPVKGNVTHIDFYEVSMTRKLRVTIPLRLVGEPVGVSQQGGILDHLLRFIEIECLPADIVEDIPIDVAELAVGKHLSVKDIKLDAAKFTILTGADLAIAAVSLPKAEEEVAAPAEGEAAEPEVLTAKKPEDGEAAEGGKEAPAKGGKEAPAKGGKEAPAKGAKEAPGKDAAPKAGKEKAGKK